MLNRAILMGRLVADPELRTTQSGISVCSFCIAVDRSYSKDKEKQTDFINIVTWRQSAEFVTKYFTKGKMIVIEGSIQTRNYEDKNGNKRTAVEVVADNVQFGEPKGTSRGQSMQEPDIDMQDNDKGGFDDDGFDEIGDSDDLPF